jgi:hypothetical protein
VGQGIAESFHFLIRSFQFGCVGTEFLAQLPDLFFVPFARGYVAADAEDADDFAAVLVENRPFVGVEPYFVAVYITDRLDPVEKGLSLPKDL